jgi:ribosomal protein S13
MSFVARLRVRMKVPIKGNDIPATLRVPGLPDIEVAQQTVQPQVCSHNENASCPVSGAPRSGGERFTFIMRGFANEALADAAGRQLAAGLLASGALGNLGIEVGFDRASLQFSASVQDEVLKKTGRELRGDYFGLMVYRQDSVTIATLEAHGFASTSAQSIQEHLTRWAGFGSTMSERQRLCAALLNDAFYAGQSEAQFILRISAVEALCDQHELGDEHIATVDSLLAHLSDLDCETQTEETLRRVLENARRQSLRHAYMTKIRTRLDEASAKKFDELYQMRSGFVHDGKGRGDLNVAAGEALEIAVRLLEADLLAAE